MQIDPDHIQPVSDRHGAIVGALYRGLKIDIDLGYIGYTAVGPSEWRGLTYDDVPELRQAEIRARLAASIERRIPELSNNERLKLLGDAS